MRILLLADMHGRTSGLEELRRVAGPFDLAILLGDITNFGDGHAMRTILDCMHGWPILGVAGNCDRPSAEQELTRRGLTLDGVTVVRDGFRFSGASRSLPCPGTTPNEATDSDLGHTLDATPTDEQDLPLILVTHQSPLNTDADKVQGGRHVGSSAIREFIARHRPILACCGHIHEARSVSRLGPTTLVNPGPWRHGFYAIAEVEAGKDPVVDLRQG